MAKLKRRQRQRLILWMQYAIFVLVVGLVVYAADWGTLKDSFFRTDIARAMFPEVITIALRNTVIFTVLAFIFGLLLGTVLALMRLSKVAPYRWVATGYIELFRGLPALLVLFMVGYGIPNAFPNREIPGGVYGQVALGLGLTAAAYMAETIRAGIQAVPKGQLEAARTLGMSHFTAMRMIVIPQAFRIVIPPLTNEFVLLIKDTALLSVIGVQQGERELTTYARDMMSGTANPTPLVAAAAMYLIITLPLTRLVAWLEKRQQRAR